MQWLMLRREAWDILRESHVDVRNGMCVIGCPCPRGHMEDQGSSGNYNHHHCLQPHNQSMQSLIMSLTPTSLSNLHLPRLRNPVGTLPDAYKRTLADYKRLQLLITIAPSEPQGTSSILPIPYIGRRLPPRSLKYSHSPEQLYIRAQCWGRLVAFTFTSFRRGHLRPVGPLSPSLSIEQ